MKHADCNMTVHTNGRKWRRHCGTTLLLLATTLSSSQAASPGALLTDAATGDTNELTIVINYGNTSRLSALSKSLAAAKNSVEIERALVAGVNNTEDNVNAALGNPLHARYVINFDRLSDRDRIAIDTAIANDKLGNVTAMFARERLERYIVLRYVSVETARLAFSKLRRELAIQNVNINRVGATISAAPSDPYFSNNGTPAQYQWGMDAMKFSDAWSLSTGAGVYVGLLDFGYLGVQVAPFGNPATDFRTHPDLIQNFRRHFLSDYAQAGMYYAGYNNSNHTIHVAGILAGAHNNASPNPPNIVFGPANTGYVAGGCPECSFTVFPYGIPGTARTDSYIGAQITEAVDIGLQIINWSGGAPNQTCNDSPVICAAINYATTRGVLIVVAAGNNLNNSTVFPALGDGPQFPGNLGDSSSVLPVGGLKPDLHRWETTQSTCTLDYCELGTNNPSLAGVMGPAQDIVSDFVANTNHNIQLSCGDTTGVDLSAPRFLASGIGDGVGTCTGTSMAAPHISALAALLRSVNPRASFAAVRDLIRSSADRHQTPDTYYGHGLPSAVTAMTSAIAANPSRLTPLFSYYSSNRSDSFYTIVPQMARAAVEGYLRLRVSNSSQYINQYFPAYGNIISSYWLPPGSPFVIGPSAPNYTMAEAWVFTSAANPKNAAVPLSRLVRMSWKCGDATTYIPAICATNPNHVDTTLVLDNEVSAFESLGYKVDGHEGYIYPANLTQPLGTVKLLRRYHLARDDHAVFPEPALSSMLGQGYSAVSNNIEWLGYVYPNPASGTMPTVQ
ncbi:MAG: S8 family serine peptidase [Proteobacteria bacterium]|nr:S8 family serine peptidase [Pseudomonadota bacterium]